jgi:hypothetical protein
MQLHILRCVWDLSKANHRPLRKVAEFRARATVCFSAHCAAFRQEERDHD